MIRKRAARSEATGRTALLMSALGRKRTLVIVGYEAVMDEPLPLTPDPTGTEPGFTMHLGVGTGAWPTAVGRP